MSTRGLLCRFCAEEKSYAEITALTSQEDQSSLIEKLSLQGISFVDFSNKMLPQTVCVTCYERVNVCYEFFLKVKRSQVVLSELCGVENDSEIGYTFSNCEAVKDESDDGEYLEDAPLSSINDGQSLMKVEKYDDETEIFIKKIPNTIPTSKDTVRKSKKKQTWSTYPWQCSCGTINESVKALREHCRKRHLVCFLIRCADCNKRLKNFEKFVAHVRRHRKVLRNYCEYCNIKMEDRTHPDSHLTETCKLCGDTFNNKNSLKSHLKLYTKAYNQMNLVGINSQTFNPEINSVGINTQTFNPEFNSVGNDTQTFNPEINSVGITTHTFNPEMNSVGFNTRNCNLEKAANGFYIKNWSDYPSVCQFCNINVLDKDVLREHCIEAHKKCFGSQCIDCDEKVVCFEDFVEHVKVHRPYLKNVCPYCNITIGDEVLDHIKKHTSSLHPCILCGQIFQRKGQLRTHEKITLPSPPVKPPKKRRKPPLKDSTCIVCGMIMKTPASLKAHLKTHTDRKRNYTCDRCGKAYYTKGSLDVHHKIHENNLKEACKICHKTFLTVSRLKKHVKTHNLELPYQCDQCKRFFNSKDRLREHVKVHMNIMPFQCQYCSKRFRHKSIMRTHENQHTGARPYSCNLCCMDFANWSNCNKHMKRKHGTTLAKNVMTPHGKLAINPKTGKPEQLFMDNVVKEWSEKMLMGRDKGNRVQIGSEVECKL